MINRGTVNTGFMNHIISILIDQFIFSQRTLAINYKPENGNVKSLL